MRAEKRILVSIPTINHPERLKLEGLLAYAHEKSGERWSFELSLGSDALHDPRQYDGVIAYVSSDAERERLVETGRATVLIEDLLRPTRSPRSRHVVTLLCDHEPEGVTAADYFLERHFRHFAWVGPDRPEPWSENRRSGFHKRLQAAGCGCTDCAARDSTELADFLRTLPRPTAVFAVHDLRARDVLFAARRCGLSVPDDIAVLGVDNDAPICETCSPALSSIPTGDRIVGYTAGRILNELLLGRARGGRIITARNHHVVTRLSTDTDAIGDVVVGRTLNWVLAHLNDKLDAGTLARRVGYSKRMLQLRFERAVGAPLGEEIRRLRVRAALEKLADTDEPVAAIAESCGFSNVSHLVLRVREATGATPLAYRRARQIELRQVLRL